MPELTKKDKLEIDEYLKDRELETMPEAKSSVSYSIKSKGGFPLIFTVRCNDEAELLSLMPDLEDSLSKSEYVGDRRGGAKTVEVTSDKCPKCGAPLVEVSYKDKKTGEDKTMWKCSTNEWDPETKQATGCDYVKWNDSPTDAATPAQIVILKEKNLWEEGMSKAQASEKISKVLGK